MEVRILICYWGMSSIPGYPSNSITHCSSTNNSKSIQTASWRSVMHFSVSFVFLLLYSSGPCYCTYTHAWHLVMSLHGRCVTQHPDSLGKITPVLDREKRSLPEVLDFPFCHLLSVGEFSCGQHGYSGPAIYPQTDLLAAKQPALVHTLRISLLLSQFSSLLSHSGLCSCLPYTVSDSIRLYLCFHLPPSTFSFSYPALFHYLSLCQGANVGLQMKQLDFHLRLPGIDMCCWASGWTLCFSDALTRENETPSTSHT